MDFEPWEAGVVFEVAADLAAEDADPDWQAECRAAVEAGIRDELTESGAGLAPAAAVVLRRMRFHAVDSHPGRSDRQAALLSATLAQGSTGHRGRQRSAGADNPRIRPWPRS